MSNDLFALSFNFVESIQDLFTHVHLMPTLSVRTYKHHAHEGFTNVDEVRTDKTSTHDQKLKDPQESPPLDTLFQYYSTVFYFYPMMLNTMTIP